MRKNIFLLSLISALTLTVMPVPTHAALPTPGSLIKAGSDAVYYYGSDGRRYVFPNQRIYNSWFSDFSGVTTVTDSELASLMIGGTVRYRPGIRMIKLQTDPKVYAVGKNGELRWVTTEQIAIGLYGTDWNQHIDDLSDAFFADYRIGEPITCLCDFVPSTVAATAETITANRSLPANVNARRSDTVPPSGNADAAPAEEEAGESETLTDEQQQRQWAEFALSDINRLRAENGKGPVVMNGLLNDIAMAHSKDMAFNIREMSHDGSLGEDATRDRIKQGKVPDHDDPGQFEYLPIPDGIGWAGENVGRRYISAFDGDVEAAIVHQHAWFMDEPDDGVTHNHRTTMLSSLAPFDTVGIGIYLDDTGIVWITEDYVSL